MMKSALGWILAIVFGILLLCMLPIVFFFGRGMAGGFGPLGGPGMFRGFGMMGRGFGLFGLLPLRLFFGWLIPVGVIVLILLAAIGLFSSLRNTRGSTLPPAAPVSSQVCPNCGRPVQSDWNTCPYCGQSLSRDVPPPV